MHRCFRGPAAGAILRPCTSSSHSSVLVLLVACNGDNPVSSASDGTGVTTVTATESTTSTTQGSAPTTSGVVTDTGTSTAGADTIPPVCPEGAIVCEGDTKKVCDGMGGFSEETPCDDVCVDGLGCRLCNPGEGVCNGDVAHVCNDAGDGYVDTYCDEVQGDVRPGPRPLRRRLRPRQPRHVVHRLRLLPDGDDHPGRAQVSLRRRRLQHHRSERPRHDHPRGDERHRGRRPEPERQGDHPPWVTELRDGGDSRSSPTAPTGCARPSRSPCTSTARSSTSSTTTIRWPTTPRCWCRSTSGAPTTGWRSATPMSGSPAPTPWSPARTAPG
ncbi:hypothetical protein [Nannocystis pusilla]|uniref:hypothetical protein n=1 Tax=Nannocystis pusilla TaxID=889268 RepID=UPI003B7C09A1